LFGTYCSGVKKLNILGGEAPSNEYAPNNFTESGYLPLINGASLGPQIRVIIDKELPKPMENKVRSLFRRMTEKRRQTQTSPKNTNDTTINATQH